MKLDATRGDHGDLYDVHGTPIRHVISADTETGICTVWLKHLKKVSTIDDPTAVLTVQHPAPLMWVPSAGPTDDNGTTTQ